MDKPTRRCLKRYSKRINDGKWLILQAVLQAYAQQKDYFLCQYGNVANIDASYSFRKLRNGLVQQEYESPFGLQARQYKLALKDSCDTLDRYWAALCEDWRQRVMIAQTLDEQEKHYLLSILLTRQSLHEALKRGTKYRNSIKINKQQRKHCHRFLRKLVRKTVKKLPRVQIKRSFVLEPETYRIFTNKQTQYIAITSLNPGERVIVPLTGHGHIRGEVRVVFDVAKQRIEIHHTVPFRVKRQQAQCQKIGIDLGVTEVFVDSDGHRYGKKFGKTLQEYSEAVKDKGTKRNKLHSLAKKYRREGLIDKAKNIEKHNLGQRKRARIQTKRRLELARQINQSVKRLLDNKAPAKVVYENLRHLTAKIKSSRMARTISFWVRSIVQDRLNFKVSQRGSLLQVVNCAYSSCLCSRCGWVAKNNRNGDTFRCRFCGFTAYCDHVAACEIARRSDDPDISLWTPKEQVKLILVERFRRRLVSEQSLLSPAQLDWASVRKEMGDTWVNEVLHLKSAVIKQTDTSVPGKALVDCSTTSGNLVGETSLDKLSSTECETRPHSFRRRKLRS